MTRKQKLKVFRTPIGFHDAYVAAPSQKAALDAWGSDTNLFASGAAEQVDDPELMREPLANPGKVIPRTRGTPAEHMAALPKDRPRRMRKSDAKTSPPPKAASRPSPKPKRVPPPKPRPDRSALDRAEAELSEAEGRHDAAKADLARRQAELDRERRKLEAEQARALRALGRRLESARGRYERAMRAWRAEG
ncbi:hypothetical protein [Sphingobium baderi]|uniref:Cell envelope biogenesis protein TolA n=1 Tax=Sphingobium baderi TaxID=1332080 RepID=A0A0S3F004_9SPHN|nr:hypothetical protein [Sphingobium baderi]ALR20983.1 hypothetical protein ATN00_12405 [Sphingobium baderi]